MRKEDDPYLTDIASKFAQIQAPQDIDPNNTDLNAHEVRRELTNTANEIVGEVEDILMAIRLNEDASIHLQDRNTLLHAGIKTTEARDPEQPDKVFLTASIQTTDEKSMPDNYGTHKITIERDVDSLSY